MQPFQKTKATAVAVAAAISAGAMLAGDDAAAQETTCDIDRTIMFAGLDYGSAAFHTALARHILEDGYGCATDRLPGGTIPLQQGVARGDLDVVMEVWTANPTQVWQDGVAAGTVVQLGTTFPDAQEGWWVPSYLVEGEDAPAPGLESVSDLPDYTELFADPEEPGMGRFYNCIAGWQCEVVNSKKLVAYGLDDDYTNFRPGTGAALAAAAESAYLREEPILFYNWTPTWLMGKFEFTMLEEPPFDRETWEAMMDAETPEAATAYPTTEVVIGANKAFSESAPAVTAFLESYGMTSDDVSAALAYMQEEDASAEEAAEWFLREHPEIWTDWVPADVAEKVRAGLS